MDNPLEAAVEQALCDLECAAMQCWCFTRAAMRQRPECGCENCKVWRYLSAALDTVPKPVPLCSYCNKPVDTPGACPINVHSDFHVAP